MRSGILKFVAICSLLHGSWAFASDPALSCQTSKLKAVSKYDACRFKGYYNAAKRASSPDFSRCSLDRFSDAETRAGGLCTTIGDQADIGSFVDFCTDSVAVALAGGSLPVDCLTCSDDLDTCNGDLGGCQGDLSATNADLGACHGSLTSCNSGLATCQGNLSSTNSDLGACNGSLGSCQSNLTATNADLGSCNGNLGTCNSSLTTCQGNLSSTNSDLGTCNGNLTTANSNLSTCQGNLGTATSGTATVGQVLTGGTFTSSAGIGVTGTMPNNGAVSITPGTASQAIAAGYHNGSGTVAGDVDLVAGNIKSGVNLFGVVGTHSSSGGYWKTGQTTCYANTGSGYTAVSCAGTGQDGEFQKGVARSFTDNGNGTVTDNFTGLVWEKLSYDNSIHDYFNSYSWPLGVSTKLATLNSTNFAGFNDWRVPNIVELQSIINFGAVNPSTFSAFNSSCSPGCTVLTCSCGQALCWSSTTYRGQISHAYTVNLNDGLTFNQDRNSTGLCLRAVRGGN